MFKNEKCAYGEEKFWLKKKILQMQKKVSWINWISCHGEIKVTWAGNTEKLIMIYHEVFLKIYILQELLLSQVLLMYKHFHIGEEDFLLLI